jgi:hypothetical protein
VLDNYVYLLLAAPPRPELETLIDRWMATYDLLVHVPIVERPSPDGVRSSDPVFQRAVEERLNDELARRGLDPLRLGDADRAGWLDAVEEAVGERLRPDQLSIPI